MLVSVGAGGVGKTTIAASLGLLAAQQGRRSLVMTIDPARRLAVSLGLDQLDHQPRLVPEAKMRAVGLPALLQAMVLDPKHTFDEVINYAQRSGVTVYTIGINIRTTEVLTRYQLKTLASVTGGRSFFLDLGAKLEREVECTR